MTTDPNGWFLASQALDHREATAALSDALGTIPDILVPDMSSQDLANELAAELARAGYALVRITPAQHERTEDLTPFLSRKED